MIFFGSEEVAQRVVRRSLDGADAVTPAVGQAAGEGPAVLHDARVVGVHGAHVVAAVGQCQRSPLPRSEVRRAEVVVARAAEGAHRVVVVLEGQRRLSAARLVVQSAHEGVAELPALDVVHGVAVDVHVGVLGIVSAILETGRTEAVAHLVGVHIPVGRDDGDVLRRTRVVFRCASVKVNAVSSCSSLAMVSTGS